MLLGEYKHNLDIKGRMAMPAKFRAHLNAGAIITRGLDRSLFVFDIKVWEEFAQKLLALPLTQTNSRAFARLMFSGAGDVAFDAQGRILIPDPLRAYAQLKKEVVVVGVYNRIEIWDAESWKTYRSTTESASNEIAERLGEMGI